jgi:2,4'-dihydroxyacetophenone dioxygenase
MNFERVDTSLMDDDAYPWMPFAPYSDLVEIKYFRADPIRGETIALLKVPPGVSLPMRHNTGTVIVYTVQGKWRHLESDWVAGPGSVVFEPASSRHTPQAIAGQQGDVIVLNVIVGETHYLDAVGNTVAIENWKTAVNRYIAHCKAQGFAPKDLTSFAG